MTSTYGDGDEYHIFRTDLIDKFVDRDWFIQCIGQFYIIVAKKWRCALNINDSRLGDVWDLWTEDVLRTVNFGIERDDDVVHGLFGAIGRLDHLKHASIISFWLRRMVPVNEMWSRDEAGLIDKAGEHKITQDQLFFLSYGSELCALLFGYYVSFNYNMQLWEATIVKQGARFKEGERERIIKTTKFPYRFIYEYPKLLRSKNISSHALYMIYHYLFERLKYPKNE